MTQQGDSLPMLQRLELNSNGEEIITECIPMNGSEFTLGRHEKASHTILNVMVSRNHCVFKKSGDLWTIVDFSTFGTKLNNKTLQKGQEHKVEEGDIIVLDPTECFKYKFCCSSSELSVLPPAKKMKLYDLKSSKVEKTYHQRCSEISSKIKAAKYEQSQIQEKETILNNSYQQKIRELEKKFELARQEMESRAVESEEQQKLLDKSRKEMESALRLEKEELRNNFEKEKEILQSKVEEQKQVEARLREENEKLQAQIEAERKEFELQLAEERRQLEAMSAQARRQAEEERIRMESQLMKRFEQLKEQQESEKSKFNEKLEKGTLDKRKLEEEHERVMQQLKEQELSAAQQFNEKQQLEERLQQMEQVLRAKEEEQKKLNEELIRKEEEKIRELENMRAQQEAENLKIREEMKTQEQVMRAALDAEIDKLKNDKLKLEADIRVEMNVESLENKHVFEVELGKVKKQLSLMESKKQFLEQELATNNHEKEKISENCLKEKQKVLQEIGDMMQSELQCQICSELFVVAMTLNCTHTFCKLCITEWKRKQTKRITDCPVCRAPIVSENRSIVLDNFIDKMVESLTDDLKEQRKELLIERGVLKVGPSKTTSTAGPSGAVASTSRAALPHYQQMYANAINTAASLLNMPVITVPPRRRAPGNVIQILRPVSNLRPEMLPQDVVRRIIVPQFSRNPVLQTRPTNHSQVPQGVAPNNAQSVPVNLGSYNVIIPNASNLVSQNVHVNHPRAQPVVLVNRNIIQPARAAPHIIRTNRSPAPSILGGARQRGGNRGGRGGTNAARRQAQGPAPRQSVPVVSAPQTATVPLARVDPDENVHAFSVANEVEIITERNPENRHNRPSSSAPNSDSYDGVSDDDEDIIVPGLPNSNYGGFGRCYNCGMKGHWSPGCPFGSRH